MRPRSRRTSKRSASGGVPSDLDHVPEYRGRGRVTARSGAAPDQTWNEIALERDHVGRSGGLPLERIRSSLFRPDPRLRGLLAEVGDGQEAHARAARGRAGQIPGGDAAQARSADVVRVEV